MLSTLIFDCPKRCGIEIHYDKVSSHICSSIKSLSNINNNLMDVKKRDNIIVIGKTGVGKSTICNILIGKKDFFFEAKGIDAGTLKASAGQGFLNDLPITVIDTQGYGDPQGRDFENTKQMITLIRSYQSAKAFLLVMNGGNIRWNESTWSVLTLFDNMFPNFWENTIFIINFWKSNPYAVAEREDTGRTEGYLRQEIKDKIKERLGEKTIRIEFLDAAVAYSTRYPELQKELRQKIDNIQLLWSFFNEYSTTSLVERKKK